MISPTRNEILKELVDYIEIITGLDRENIVRGKQNAPSPLNSYCTILYLTNISVGTHNILIKEIEGNETELNYSVRGKRIYTFSVEFYREGATDLAKSIIISQATPIGKEQQLKSVFTINKINNLTEAGSVISQNYEERSILNLELLINEKITVVVNKLAQVNIDFLYDFANIEIIKNLEINENGEY